MTADDLKIPQIDLPEEKSESVLVPQVDNKETEVQSSVSQPQENAGQVNKLSNKPLGLAAKIALGALALIAFIIIAAGVPAFLTYQKGISLYKSVKNLQVAAKSQDLSQIKPQIVATQKSLKELKSSYNFLSWTQIIPFAGSYVADLGHTINAAEAGMEAGTIVLTTIEPYADLLGLKGAEGQQAAQDLDGAKTAQDRIDFIVKSLPSLLPQIDNIAAKMEIVENESSQISAERYPVEFKGIKIRSTIKTAQDLIDQASNLLVNGKPVIENAPYLLGMDSPRTYFVLFQNDKELRPTGGFMTAYAIMNVDKAKFNPTLSDDIYNLDAKYRPSIQAPEPIVKYIKGPYVLSENLRLRDMNWSPDFVKSMDMVVPALAEAGVKDIDGIIAVDTKVLENLLEVIGPIGVPGFGTFSTEIDPECNCSQVIHALESYADVEGPIIWDPLTGKIILRPANSENRKKIIGPLMNSILANAMGQPKEKLAPLFSAAFNSVMEKSVLFYLNDEKVQKAVVDFGIAGTIKDYDGDYLHINDANLGGRKSNLYATEEVQQDVKIAGDGTVTKTVTITYKNPEKHDGWLNSVLPTWVRVYVPKGSTLVAADGFETKDEPYEDLNKTVYAGYFQLRPEGVSKITIQYKLPFKVKGQYKLMIQKQPGTKNYLYSLNVGKTTQEFFLKTDKEIKIGL